jgi:hypothetical protein
MQVLPRGPFSGMPTGQASRASVLTSACPIRACGASSRYSAILNRSQQRQQKDPSRSQFAADCKRTLCSPFPPVRSRARSSKRTVRLISEVALDECLDPERYRARVPFRNVVEGVRIDEELVWKASVVHAIASANLAPSAINGRSPA